MTTCVGPGADLIVLDSTIRSSMYTQWLWSADPCTVAENCFSGLGARRVLRFSTDIANIGCQDYVIGAPPSDTSTSERGWSWHACHNHWHYENYAHYWLQPLCSAHNHSLEHPVAAGHKNGWCVMDIGPHWPVSVGSRNCWRTCYSQGISAGCYDRYAHTLNCQWIDITNVPFGMWTLGVATNWDVTTRQSTTPELNYSNNAAHVAIRLDSSGVHALSDADIRNACLPTSPAPPWSPFPPLPTPPPPWGAGCECATPATGCTSNGASVAQRCACAYHIANDGAFCYVVQGLSGCPRASPSGWANGAAWRYCSLEPPTPLPTPPPPVSSPPPATPQPSPPPSPPPVPPAKPPPSAPPPVPPSTPPPSPPPPMPPVSPSPSVPPQCATWCGDHDAVWDVKCEFVACGACSECFVSPPLPPSNPPPSVPLPPPPLPPQCPSLPLQPPLLPPSPSPSPSQPPCGAPPATLASHCVIPPERISQRCSCHYAWEDGCDRPHAAVLTCRAG